MNTSSHTSTRVSNPSLLGRGRGRGSEGTVTHGERLEAFTLVELLVVIAVIIVLVGIGLTVGNSVVRGNEINRTKTTLANALQVATEYDVKVGQIVNHLASRYPGTAGNPPQDPAPVKDWQDLYAFNSPVGAAGNGKIKIDRNSRADAPPNAMGSDEEARQGDIARYSVERFVWVTRRVASLEKLYATFRPETLKNSDDDPGFLEIQDAWGSKLIYAAYVKDDTAYPSSYGSGVGDPADDFLPKSDTYFFASAGPDKKWGHANPENAPNLTPYKLAGETNEQAIRRLREEAGDNVYSDDTLQVR